MLAVRRLASRTQCLEIASLNFKFTETPILERTINANPIRLPVTNWNSLHSCTHVANAPSVALTDKSTINKMQL